MIDTSDNPFVNTKEKLKKSALFKRFTAAHSRSFGGQFAKFTGNRREEGASSSMRIFMKRLNRPELAALFGVIVFLTWIGPFGTQQDLWLLPRTVYWAGSILTGSLAALWSMGRLLPFLRRRWGVLPALFYASLVQTIMMVAIVCLFEAMMRSPVPVSVLPGLVPNVLAITFFIVTMIWLVQRKVGQGEAAKARPEATPAPRSFGERLPEHLRASPIHAMQAEDHYIRVYTAAGDALVPGRFTDFITEIGVEGCKTHRSWWVAEGAVERLTRSGRNWSVQLSGGVKAPVSRSALATVRDRGWPQDG